MPALLKEGICLVVSPLIALIKDQVQNLNKKGIGALAIYAGMSFMNGGEGTRNIKAIIFTGVLGAVFFFAGISLIKNTKDKAT